jgi:hypothetical protein
MIRLNEFLKDLGMTFIIHAYQDYGQTRRIYHITFVQYLFDEIFFSMDFEDNIITFGIAMEENLIPYSIKKMERK